MMKDKRNAFPINIHLKIFAGLVLSALFLFSCGESPSPESGIKSGKAGTISTADTIPVHDSLLIQVLPQKMDGFPVKQLKGGTFISESHAYAEVSRVFFTEDSSQYISITLADYSGDMASFANIRARYESAEKPSKDLILDRKKIKMEQAEDFAWKYFRPASRTTYTEAGIAGRYHLMLQTNQKHAEKELKKVLREISRLEYLRDREKLRTSY